MIPINTDDLIPGRLYTCRSDNTSILRFVDRIILNDINYVRFEYVSGIDYFFYDKDALVPFSTNLFVTFYQLNFKYGK